MWVNATVPTVFKYSFSNSVTTGTNFLLIHVVKTVVIWMKATSSEKITQEWGN